jgi:PAS domain S-box-containing protein
MHFPQHIPQPRSRIRGLAVIVLSATLFGILLSVLSVSFFTNSVQREVDALAVANSDTTQWTLVQAEVELLALQVAVHHAYHVAETPDLTDVRKRFDVLYSRVRLIEESRQFADLRENPDAARSIAAMNAFLERYTPLVDGTDPALSASLPAMAEDLTKLRSTGRDFSLLGIRFYAADSDRKREAVATMLTNIGYVTIALVVALLSGIAVLLALYRRSIRSERLAAEARNRLEEVFATSLDGIIATDADGKVIEYNGAAEQLFGFSRAEAIGRDMGELIIPDNMRAAHSAGLKRSRHGQKQPSERVLDRLEAVRKDGTKCLVEISLSSGTYGGKKIYVSFLRDITDRVAAEKELIRTRDSAVAGERAKAELLAVMSHEMRTPLNGILGTIELLQNTKLAARQERLLSAMKTSAGLLLHHVNGVLSMSRAEAGQLDLVPTEIDPGTLLQELVESQRSSIEAHGNQIRCDATSAPKRIWSDALRLRQVILNLVGNANKFTRNGEILVECDTIPERNQVEFRVIDTGIGIDEKDLTLIFEEFRTLDTSYSRQAEGTGLGLAISRRLVKAMGGEIGVDSEPGEGSLFWVRLPVGAPDLQDSKPVQAPDLRSEPSKRKTDAAGMRILLVEDNQINRLVAREMLQSAGHSVVEAMNGREGVHFAARQSFDAILMDISMPEMDGVAATTAIRGQEGPNRETPIIALTAHALPEDTQRFLAAGITDTLVKPLSMAALKQSLTGVMGARDAPQPVVASVYCDLVDAMGREKAARLMERFEAEGNALVARTTTTEWESIEPAQRADAVHKLAGSAAVLGAGQLRRVLQGLENAYRQGEVEAAARGQNDLASVWQKTRAELRTCLETLGQS